MNCIQWDGSDIIGYNREHKMNSHAYQKKCEYCKKETHWLQPCSTCRKYFNICYDCSNENCLKCNRDKQIDICIELSEAEVVNTVTQ